MITSSGTVTAALPGRKPVSLFRFTGENTGTTPSYDWTQFRFKIEISAPVEKVFAAWTNEKIITRWFPVTATIDPVKGGRIAMTWLGGDAMDVKIIDIKKNRLLVIPFGGDKVEVAVHFTKIKTGTRLELHQYNMKTSPKAKIELHMGCKQGWTFFLANLKAYLERGVDLRSHDPQKSYRQGYCNS